VAWTLASDAAGAAVLLSGRAKTITAAITTNDVIAAACGKARIAFSL